LDWDVSASQMMLTVKLYSIAWNLWDGRELQKAKNDENYPLSRATKNCSKFAITKIPSFLEFMGYCLNFSTAIVGSNYEFVTYKNVCDGTFVMAYYNKFHTYPSRLKPVLIPFLTSLFFALYYFYLLPYFHYFSLTSDDKIPTIISEKSSLLYQIMAFSVYKSKFYFVWKAVEGSGNLFYAGFEGLNAKDEIIGWDNTNNVDILRTESVQNSKAFSRDWNKKTAIWLNRYIYQRYNGNMLITFFISALWHGFYPGYYITFFTLAFISFFEQIGRDRITPLFGNHLLYQFACIVYMKYVEIYTFTPFIILSWEYSIEVLKQHYFFLYIFLITFYVLHKLF